MALLKVRDLPDDVHRALRLRAAEHGRSTEAEVREILAAAVRPQTQIRLGDALASLGQKIGLTDEDIEFIQASGDEKPAEPLRFK